MEKSAQAMYDEGLVNFGYNYANIDDGWEIKAGSNDPVVGGAVRNPDGTIQRRATGHRAEYVSIPACVAYNIPSHGCMMLKIFR
ncbi:MAG: hypothetical protein LBT78_06365 [Tannerella sp.]|jgi:hypothetical protein|nr:hypothetical protein [Tannerella sp.]